jgi:hypothetical protein
MRSRAFTARILRDGTISPVADRLERRSVEFVIVTIGDAHGTFRGTQLGTHDAKLAGEALGFVDRIFRVFEDHTSLAFELCTDDEIEIEVWHCGPLPSSNLHQV